MGLSHAYKLRRGSAQEGVVRACTAHDGVDQAFVGDLAGVSRSTVSEWISGEAQMEVWHLARLVEAFGADILGVRPRTPRVDLGRELRQLSRAIVDLHDDVVVDLEDGTHHDREAHARRLEQAIATATDALATLRRTST